jgi:hypothetical protein
MISTTAGFVLLSALGLGAEPGGQTKNKTFTVSKGGLLEVSISSGDIRVNTWDRNEVTVLVRISDEDDENDVQIVQSGNTVRVTDDGGWGYDDARYDISVPVKFNIDLRTHGGNLSVIGRLEGNISGETSGGEIKTGDVTGNIEVQTSGGEIRVGKIGGNGLLSTSGGNVEVGDVGGELEVRTSGGEIRLGNVVKSLRAHTSGGDVYLGDVGGASDVSTSGGYIRAGRVNGRSQLRSSGGDIDLLGGNGTIRATTGGGNLRLLDITGTIDGRTGGGDIYVELSPKGASKLASGAGRISLHVQESAKATIEARIKYERKWGKSSGDRYTIRSDFKADNEDTMEDGIRGRFMLNGGGDRITLETYNSDIEIRKKK